MAEQDRFTNLSFAKNPSGPPSSRDPFITVVEAAEFWDFDDHAMVHDLTLNRTLFIQGQMGTRTVVVAKIRA